MIKYRVIATAAIFFAIAVLSAIPLHCQDDHDKTIDGVVMSVDPQNSLIVIKAYENFTFHVSPDATITNKDGIDIKLSDINTGTYVMVDYYNDRSGAHIARTINVDYNN